MMDSLRVLILLTAAFLLLARPALAQHWNVQPSGTASSLRGLSVVSDRVVWASGNHGTVLRTVDGGKTWTIHAVPDSESLDFRGIQAFNSDSAALMASGEGKQSAVYKTADGGAAWKIWYPNQDAKGFFDAIVLPDPAHGMVLGDPVDGMFTLFRLDQEGTLYSHIRMPAALPDEGAFAASNTSLVLRGSHVWFATGGPSGARVFRSDDAGEHWSIAQTPLRGNAKGAGIFSLAFSDARHGIAVGGDYEKPSEGVHNVALSSDGGVTWVEPKGARPRGYRSAVAWLPKHKMWITTGPTGSEVSRDGGQTWKPFDDAPFNALGVGPGDDCWAVGPKGRIAKLEWSAPNL